MTPLARALEHLERAPVAREEALDALLAAWRETRAPEIADAIDLVSDEVTRALPPIEGKTRRAFQEAWIDVAADARAIDVGRLAAAFGQEPCTQIGERLARFEAQAHDPRIARALVAFVERRACTSSPNFPLWTRVWALLVAHRDTRTRGVLLAKRKARPLYAGAFEEIYSARLEKALPALVPPPPLAPEDAALVVRIAARARDLLAAPPEPVGAPKPRATPAADTTEDALLREVYATPDADGPRLVYGDWLLERGDPRGELVALQFQRQRSALTTAQARRERKLLAEHGRKWLGPLEPVVVGDFAFERGFLASCTAAFRTKKQIAALATHPAWATVHTISMPPFELVVGPGARALRSVVASQEVAARIAAHEAPLALQSLAFPIEDVPAALATISHGRAFVALRRLELHTTPQSTASTPLAPPVALLEGALARRLEELLVVTDDSIAWNAHGPDVGAWLRTIDPLPKLRRVELRIQPRWPLVLDREPGGRWALTIPSPNPRNVEPLVAMLRDVPRGTFTQIVLPGAPEIRAVVAPYASP